MRGSGDGKNPWAHWPGNLAELISFKFSERPPSQKNKWGEIGEDTLTSGLYLHINAHTNGNKYIYKNGGGRHTHTKTHIDTPMALKFLSIILYDLYQ